MSGREPSPDLLIEIGCEELPPKSLDSLRESLFQSVCQGLEAEGLEFDVGRSLAWSTPRRLSLMLSNVAASQPDRQQDRRGPALKAAFDGDGKPTPAAEGFARSVGKSVEELDTLKNDKGEWLFCRLSVQGKTLEALLPSVLEKSLRQLPVPRPMRWANHDFSFVRPVHWLVVLHGETVLPVELLGKTAGRSTRGHRIHAPGPHDLRCAAEYLEALRRSFVLADHDERRERIATLAAQAEPNVIIDEALLAEVNNLVEWPVAVRCTFDDAFLDVPHAALVASMQDHQKFFPVSNPGGAASSSITNAFVAIANLESKQIDEVRAGFERVIRPRLADARFFFEQDQRRPLSAYRTLLDRVIFEEKIGTVGDRSNRIESISREIAEFLEESPDHVARAAQLAKCDLMTQMVAEFPELQGTMGQVYAASSGESPEVASAIGEHYAPRFSGDAIPESAAGRWLSLADRADTLVGIFAAGLKPSGNKDPYALRRAALGVVRILLEGELPIEPDRLLSFAADELAALIDDREALLVELSEFVDQRARNHLHEQGFSIDLINAATRSAWSTYLDLHRRLEALAGFMGSEDSESLAAANKRIGNILRKADEDFSVPIDADRFILDEERRLFEEISTAEQSVSPLLENGDYASALARLALLRPTVDRFFNEVMVMDEDERIRVNRLALLNRLKTQFDGIGDLSVLS